MLWERAMADVRRMRAKADTPASPELPASPDLPAKTTALANPPAPTPPVPPTAPKPKSKAAPKSAPIPLQRQQTSRRDDPPTPEAILDLHGLTQDAAHRALTRFLARARTRGLRAVLIITGKGGPLKSSLAKANNITRSDDAAWGRPKPGILRELVPLWLETDALRGGIISMERAHHRKGGEGAILVRLRSPLAKGT